MTYVDNLSSPTEQADRSSDSRAQELRDARARSTPALHRQSSGRGRQRRPLPNPGADREKPAIGAGLCDAWRRSRRPMPSTGRTRSRRSITGCRSCVRVSGPARSPGSRGASARLSCCRRSIRSSTWTAALTTRSRKPSPAACRPPNGRMRASSRRWRQARRARSAARRWRAWRAGTAVWAATRCAPPCSAPMTGSSPI